jgi:hypothetical protein
LCRSVADWRRAGTNLDSSCNRNTYAYPYLVSQQRPNTQLTFVACSGAVTGDVTGKQVPYADPNPGFSGHDVCASTPYVNGFKLFPSGDSYHPTRAGYASGYTPLVRSIIG